MKHRLPLALVALLFACQDDDAYTQADCEADGGHVVSDIGDGSIHAPDYKCDNGSPPIRSVTDKDGNPLGIEGAVCCGS